MNNFEISKDFKKNQKNTVFIQLNRDVSYFKEKMIRKNELMIFAPNDFFIYPGKRFLVDTSISIFLGEKSSYINTSHFSHFYSLSRDFYGGKVMFWLKNKTSQKIFVKKGTFLTRMTFDFEPNFKFGKEFRM